MTDDSKKERLPKADLYMKLHQEVLAGNLFLNKRYGIVAKPEVAAWIEEHLGTREGLLYAGPLEDGVIAGDTVYGPTDGLYNPLKVLGPYFQGELTKQLKANVTGRGGSMDR